MDPRTSSQSRAEAVYAALLVENPQPTPEQIAELAQRHPELAAELASLQAMLASWPGMALRLGLPGQPGAGEDSNTPPQLSGFRCIKLLGRGGMGEVWEAQDLTLNRQVAIKLLRTSWAGGAVALQRFQREAQAAGRVQHPCIVAVYQTGESSGRHFIVQELIPGGRTLRDEIEELRRSGELPENYIRLVAERFLKLARALEAAHAAGIIHRDLKPQNVLLTKEGDPKVADFGLAMLESDLALSRSGEFLGTYFYASPEQIEANRQGLDERTDIFSLGATLYECLTLTRAFEGDTAREVSRAVVERDPTAPHEVRRRVPLDLSTICLKALEKRSQDRYASMRDLAEDLRRFLANEPILAHPPSLARRALKWVHRHPTIATALAVSFAASLALALLLWRSEGLRKKAAEANAQLQETSGQLRVESETATEVVSFLLGMFDQIDPEVSGNRRPTVRELLNPALERVESTEIQNKEVRARLMHSLSYAVGALGDLQRSRRCFEKVLALRAEMGQATSIAAGRTVLTLFTMLTWAGDNTSARELLQPWIDRIGESETFDRELASKLLLSLAELQLENRQVSEAAETLASAEEFCKKYPNSEVRMHLTRAYVGLHLSAGELLEAEALLRKELELCEAELRVANPRALSLLNTLGLVLTADQRLDDAEALYLDLANQLNESLSAFHPSRLIMSNNLARVWQAQGRFDDAEGLYREIIQARQEQYGEGDLGVLGFMNNLGTCLALGGRPEEAVEVHETVWTRRKEAFGREDDSTLQSQNNLAYALYKIQRNAEALALQEEVVALTPADHPAFAGRRTMLEDIRLKLNLQQ